MDITDVKTFIHKMNPAFGDLIIVLIESALSGQELTNQEIFQLGYYIESLRRDANGFQNGKLAAMFTELRDILLTSI